MSEVVTPSLRRGSYYVSAFDPDKGLAAGYYLLAGPWPTHAEALTQVDTVRTYAERVDVMATWMAFGTCRRDDDKASKLGSDAAAWSLLSC